MSSAVNTAPLFRLALHSGGESWRADDFASAHVDFWQDVRRWIEMHVIGVLMRSVQ